jgi:RNA polymerase sigma-70 factor (ECF subfamily)
MSTGNPKSPALPSREAWFTTTHWSVVLAARDQDSAAAQEALEKLCSAYWYPLYVFVRRLGHETEQAKDLTQDFFAKLLSRRSLEAIEPQKGRFRSFLLVAMKHFLSNEWDKTRRLKRGGQFHFVSWEEIDAERRYEQEPAHGLSPDRLYERAWACRALEGVLERLRKEYAALEKQRLFEALQMVLTDPPNASSYAEIGASLGMGEGAVKMAALRLRRRYAELLRLEIAHTVGKPEEVEEEIRHLMAVLE